ncbi:PDZK1-interacting protein 1 isoform X2 [Leucoraja erinacea]|uniref:PDZK1-interacting protein 1 isoform X2 n=1 Tax=Leucoraja erinaceus TaxID=7782 RepID=UPI00245409BF|nr:PDZK1-interacting protein 1 isoform X2 [Leucoraja erinacea]
MLHHLQLYCVFFALVSVQAQNVETKEQPRRGLQPWLTGIIAVVVFLCLCFIGFIVNKIWCTDPEVSNHLESPAPEADYANTNGTQITETLTLKDVRSSEHPGAYENIYEIPYDESPKITITAM